MVSKMDDSGHAAEIFARGSPEALEQLRDDIRGRYSDEELGKIISGEGWSPPRSASKADLAAYLNDLLDRLARASSEQSQTTS